MPLVLALLLLVVLLGLVWGVGWVRERPLTRYQLEQQMGDWLAANSIPGATVAGSPRIAKLAGRTALQLADETDLVGSLLVLEAAPPDYVIVSRHIAADQLIRTGWFQERYTRLHEAASPYYSASPYTIWGYRPTIYELGTAQPLNVHAAEAIDIVGYEFGPQRAVSGQPVRLTLFLKSRQPVTQPLVLTTRLEAADGQVVAETTHNITPPVEVGAIASETLAILDAVDLPVGAYEINFSLGLPGEPVWPLYRNNDTNQLDRVRLGHLVVPWQGNWDTTVPISATFGDQIDLTAFTIEPGEGVVDVTLYWQALRPPDEDYVVFVHALDAAGNFLAGHDGAPVNGRFPTSTWLIGDVVGDKHSLAVPESAELQFQVGLYLPETGERLPVWDNGGVERPSRAMPLE